jgi:hypothetical protein
MTSPPVNPNSKRAIKGKAELVMKGSFCAFPLAITRLLNKDLNRKGRFFYKNSKNIIMGVGFVKLNKKMMQHQ